MGCNIPRPWKRPPTPADKEIMEKAINEPLASLDRIRNGLGLDPISDQPYGSRTNEAVEALTRFSRAEIEAFKQFGQVAHDLTYYDTDLDQTIKERRTNCPNCCATITGPICEYCGTRFPEFEQHYQIMRTTENQEIVIPIYVGNQQIDEVIRRSNQSQFRSGDCSGSPGTTTQLR